MGEHNFHSCAMIRIAIGLLVLYFLQPVAEAQLLTTFNLPKLKSDEAIFHKNDLEDGRLILTPYLEAGQQSMARRLARVDRGLFLNTTSYAGYLTVDREHDSNLFFWFFPAAEHDSFDSTKDADDLNYFKRISPKEPSIRDKPIVLWLQGGPGVSSLFALFTENGPFLIDEDDPKKLKRNPYSWHDRYHLLFIDNPVGTGFSFTNIDGYCRSIPQVAKQLYSGLLQFFKLFSYLQRNDFYITGESFAGKYIPAIGNEILEQNGLNQNYLKINLQGLALGNALSDPFNMVAYSEYAYQLGLIGRQGYKEMQITENLVRANIKNPKLAKVVREAIHVGDQPFFGPNAVYTNLVDDFMTSAIHWTERLLDSGIRIMYYNGNWDFIVAYPLSENAFHQMKWSGADRYKTAERKPFLVKGKLKGYVTQVENFYEVSVLNAGHMVPTDQPEACLTLIDRFFNGQL